MQKIKTYIYSVTALWLIQFSALFCIDQMKFPHIHIFYKIFPTYEHQQQD